MTDKDGEPIDWQARALAAEHDLAIAMTAVRTLVLLRLIKPDMRLVATGCIVNKVNPKRSTVTFVGDVVGAEPADVEHMCRCVNATLEAATDESSMNTRIRP